MPKNVTAADFAQTIFAALKARQDEEYGKFNESLEKHPNEPNEFARSKAHAFGQAVAIVLQLAEELEN
jgi:hypothetical protein